jgi:hypothetical protein
MKVRNPRAFVPVAPGGSVQWRDADDTREGAERNEVYEKEVGHWSDLATLGWTIAECKIVAKRGA